MSAKKTILLLHPDHIRWPVKGRDPEIVALPQVESCVQQAQMKWHQMAPMLPDLVCAGKCIPCRRRPNRRTIQQLDSRKPLRGESIAVIRGRANSWDALVVGSQNQSMKQTPN
jgi:hypothetical protein